ncbi:MAG: hypothetical protein HOQ24_14245, partial [Mycobacteriaceae bacterium]|nr:hypothetical protein [Mycobacteriaceae bacterium]
MGDDRYGRSDPGSARPRRRDDDEEPQKSRHADPNRPDSGMISVRDLVARVEREKPAQTGGILFPSGAIPRAANSPQSGPFPAAAGPPPQPEPPTEQIPRITVPPTPDQEPPGPAAPVRAVALRGAGRTAAAPAAVAAFAAAGHGWGKLHASDAGYNRVAALNPHSAGGG